MELTTNLDWYWNWRVGFGLGAVFGIGSLILSCIIPESNYWIKAKKEASLNETKQDSGSWAIFFQPKFRQFVGLGFMLAITLQLTGTYFTELTALATLTLVPVGVNAIIYFAPKILTGAGFDIEDTLTIVS